MAPPTQERPKVMIPLPPLPEFYLQTTEGYTVVPSSSSSGSHAKDIARSRKQATKLVATVEVQTKPKTKAPAQPILPPAKPLSFEAVVDARPTVIHTHSAPLPVNFPAVLPPSLPPGFELVDQEDMAHRYSYRHHHEYKQPVKEAKPAKASQPQPARVINIPPPPPGFPGTFAQAEPAAQKTITIRHVCRICMRPRSEKYHQEHPIPPGVVPPPPGICKRCRITSVEEKKDQVKVIHVEESNNVKLGLFAFLPQDNQYTRKEASEAINKQHRRGYGEIYVRENSSEEDAPERIVYRHVKRTVKSASVPPSEEQTEVTAENLAAMNLMNDRSPPPDTGRTTMKVNVGSDYLSPEAGTPLYLPQTVYVAETRKVEHPDTHTSSSSRKSGKSGTDTERNKAASSAKVSVSVKSKPSAAGDEAKTTAKARATVPVPAMPGFTESEIRTFARDEVERYRQAERMMDAHPNPYAHGRMVPVTPPVPVERRIEAVRDEAPSMPWEAPSSPPRETVYTTLRARGASGASKDGPGHTQKVPSEDSRYWYRPAEPSLNSTKSTSSKDSAATIRPPSTRHAASHDKRDKYEIDVTLIDEHERRSAPLQGPPESDPRTGLPLKEIVETVREESSRRGFEPDYIEASEKFESAPDRTADPVVSRRLRMIARDDTAQRQSSPPQSQEGGESKRPRDDSLLRTQERYWHHGVVRTASGLSSPRHVLDTDSRAGGNGRQPERETDVAVVATEEVVSMPSPSKFTPKPSSHGRSDDASWYATRVKAVKTHQEAPEETRDTKKSQKDEDDKTTWHPEDEPARPAASSKAAVKPNRLADDDYDWEYTKRIVTASNRPLDRVDDDTAPGRHYVDTERTFRRRRPSEPDAREPDPPVRGHNQPRQHTKELQDPRVPARQEIAPDLRWNSGRESYVHTSDVPSQVRFASKVEFSSTPRRSDESSPEQVGRGRSSGPRSKGPLKGSGLKNQLDGGASEPTESAPPTVGPETTYSSRGRLIEREEDTDYPWVFPDSFARGSARSGSAAQQSFRSDPRSFRTQESRRSTRTREDDGLTQDPPADEEELRSRRYPRFSTQDEETATQPSQSHRLARALSESPSREKMRKEYVYLQKQREERSETMVSRGRQSERSESKVDDKGPYREMSPRTESMDALYGSGHGGPKKRQHEYSLREEW